MFPHFSSEQGQTVSSQSSQTACASNARLWLLLHDQLPSSEDVVISQHVEFCQLCQRRLEELSSPQYEDPPTAGRFGRYQLGLELGRGSSGVVFLAQATDSREPIALKLLTEQAAQSEVGRERFLREIRTLQSLEHPGIVAVRDAGESDGRWYLAMEYVSGGTLADFSQRRPVPEKTAAAMIAATAVAIHYCHQRGVIHRDLKPRNILLGRAPASGDADAAKGAMSPRIADFGIARIDTDSHAITETGAIVGTLDYMAPEQLEHGHRITGAADIYSLGAILFELLTGSPPHRAATFPEMISAIRDEDPPRLRSLIPGASPSLELICERCLQKDPLERYASAGLLADDLQRFLNSQRPLIRPVPVWRRVRRWSLRNPGRASVILAVSLGAFLVTAASLIVARREQLHARAMEEERDRTQKLFRESLNAYRMLDSDIEAIVEPSELSTAELLDQVEHILRFMEPLLEQAPERFDYRSILANAWHYHSRLLQERPESASEGEIVVDYERCIEHCDRLKRTTELSSAVRRKFAILGANTRNNVGNYYRDQQNWVSGERYLNEAIQDWEELLRQSPEDPDYRVFHALATQNWVWLQWAKLTQEWSAHRPAEAECSETISALMFRLQHATRTWEQVFATSPEKRVSHAEKYSTCLQLEADLLMLEENWREAQQAVDRLLQKCPDANNTYIGALEYKMNLVRSTRSEDSVVQLQNFLKELLRLRKTDLMGVQTLIQSDDFALISSEYPEIAEIASEVRTHFPSPDRVQ